MYEYRITIKGKLDDLDTIARVAQDAQNAVLNIYDPGAKVDMTIKDRAPIEPPPQPQPQPPE